MGLPDAIIYLADQFSGGSSAFPTAEWEGEARAARQQRVLVVDDERLLADTTAAILRRAGFQARAVYDGFAALEVAASFHPDYILTDIMMPAMNGVDLAIAITRNYPATKILLISGQAGISDLLEESRARGFEFPLLAKPVHPSHLVEALRELNED